MKANPSEASKVEAMQYTDMPSALSAQQRGNVGFSTSAHQSSALLAGESRVDTLSASRIDSSPTEASVSPGLLYTCAHLRGQKIPLDLLTQTSLSWSDPPCMSSTEASQNSAKVVYSCPPKIEWSSKYHQSEQKEHHDKVEQEIYERFLAFGGSQRIHCGTIVC